MISRRFFLSGLLSVPAIVSIDSLMPIRGIKMVLADTVARTRTFQFSEKDWVSA